MITKQDLLEAIAECQGTRSPNANTAIKLAAFYTILDHLEDEQTDKKPETRSSQAVSSYSFAEPKSDAIRYSADSDFARAIDGRQADEILPIFDELMSTIKMTNERLYNGVMRKLQQ